MSTNREALWRSYYAAVKAGKKIEAKMLLKQIHSDNRAMPRRPGGCSRCQKRWG